MKRSAAVLVALALAGPLAACGGDDGDERTLVSGSASSSAEASPSQDVPTPSAAPVEPTAAPTSGGEPQEAAPEDFPADVTADVQEDTSGGPLSVRDVRVAHHDGYDRVVFELAGREPGTAGWRVEYVDEPSQQGSGNPVEVGGAAALSVLVLGTGYPMDTGVEEPAADPALPGDLEVVEDVVLGSVYEGQYEAFVGTASRQPFRVFRLSDPERVVIDVQTP
jgi:hypothetical protein